MDIYKIIIDALKKEYADGATYDDLNKKYGVSRAYLHQLLHGDSSPARMSLEVFFKLFPHASIAVNGSTVTNVVNNGHNSGSMIGTAGSGDIVDIVDKILKSDLSAEEKVKFIELVRK